MLQKQITSMCAQSTLCLNVLLDVVAAMKHNLAKKNTFLKSIPVMIIITTKGSGSSLDSLIGLNGGGQYRNHVCIK